MMLPGPMPGSSRWKNSLAIAQAMWLMKQAGNRIVVLLAMAVLAAPSSLAFPQRDKRDNKDRQRREERRQNQHEDRRDDRRDQHQNQQSPPPPASNSQSGNNNNAPANAF